MALRSSPQGAFYLSLPWEASIGQGASSVQGDTFRAQNAKDVLRLLTSRFGFSALQEGWDCYNMRLFISGNILLHISSDMKINLG